MKHQKDGAGLARRLALSAAVIAAIGAGQALAAEPVSVGEKTFPESITSTSDGTLYIGSLATGNVYRAAPGATNAELFITKEQAKTNMVLGVLADEKTSTLWVCSSIFGQQGAPPAELKAFDLSSGEQKGNYAFGGGSPVCNDVAIAADGTLYATSTSDGKIFRLKAGASALDEWLGTTPELQGGIDGIAFDNGEMYVNNVQKGTLFRVAVNADGSAGALTQINTGGDLQGPDGMRPASKGGLWIAQNRAGTVTHAAINGDTATMTTIKDGLDSPPAITEQGGNVWVIEAKFRFLFGPDAGKDPGPFLATPIPVN